MSRFPNHISSGIALVGFGLLMCASACSIYVEPNRQQCSSDTDCTRRGGAAANSTCVNSVCQVTSLPQNTEWGCLGKVSWPDAGSGYVNATLDLKDMITNQPVAGVTARLCRKLDTKCDQPVLDGLESDSLGKLVIHAPMGFDGYAELQPADAIPGIYFFYPPLIESREIPFVPILPLSELSTFAQLVSGEVLQGRGHLVLGTYNCLHNSTEGVSLSSAEADSKSLPFYMIKGVPSSKATATDGSGYGGILNLIPGTATLTGKLSSGESLGTESVLIRADQITYSTLLPLPG